MSYSHQIWLYELQQGRADSNSMSTVLCISNNFDEMRNIEEISESCFFHGLEMRWEKPAALIPWFTFESGFSKKSRLPLKWGWAGDKNISAGYRPSPRF